MIIAFATGIVSLFVCIGLFVDYKRIRQMPYLPPPPAQNATKPLVSILIPARNEEQTIGRCLDGALHQLYHQYEVIVVDDRSTDATPLVLAHYAAHNAHMRVISGCALPPDWTGKSYACYQAASVARGEWLVFLDADTIPQPTLIAALIAHAEQQHIDMVTLFPFLELGSFWEKVILPAFIQLLHAVFPLERINAPDVQHDEIIANGQCICVRRAAYDAIGGHSAVAGNVVEDVMLARTLHRAGYRVGAAVGTHDLRVRMYTNRRDITAGLTKNAIAGFLSGGKRSFWVGSSQFAIALLPLPLLLFGTTLVFIQPGMAAWVVCGQGISITLLAISLWAWVQHQLYALPWWYAVLVPIGFLCYGFITIHSLWRIRSGRGVIWKGRTYAGI